MLPVKDTSVSSQNAPVQPAPAPRLFSPLEAKVQQFWQGLVDLLSCSFCQSIPVPPAHQIQKKIDAIAAKEAEFKAAKPSIRVPKRPEELQKAKQEAQKQQDANLQKHHAWLDSHQEAFVGFKKVIAKNKIDPTHLPREIAAQLGEIFTRYGLAMYSNNVIVKPFESALDMLKLGILMQQYALGLSEACPDFSQVRHLDDLCKNEEVRAAFIPQANTCIDNLDPKVWAEKVRQMTQNQVIHISKAMRFANGAILFLKMNENARNEKMLATAEACIKAAQQNPKFNKADINDEMAELIYNDFTGVTSMKIEKAEKEGQSDEVKALKETLAKLWQDCVLFSKEPEKMRARCCNKRTFMEKLSLQEIADLRIQAIQAHLSLPKEKQDKVLIAFAWNNLSHAQENLGQPANAFKSVTVARAWVMECMAAGIDNIHFPAIIQNAQRWMDILRASNKPTVA